MPSGFPSGGYCPSGRGSRSSQVRPDEGRDSPLQRNKPPFVEPRVHQAQLCRQQPAVPIGKGSLPGGDPCPELPPSCRLGWCKEHVRGLNLEPGAAPSWALRLPHLENRGDHCARSLHRAHEGEREGARSATCTWQASPVPGFSPRAWALLRFNQRLAGCGPFKTALEDPVSKPRATL